MKIVELIIDELEELMGFDAVALVNQPAIEANFHAFKNEDVDDAIVYQLLKHEVFKQVKESFVTKLPGESKDDYIARCIPAIIKEGYDQDQATAICYSDWESFDETEDVYELEIGDYQTRHYDMCPGATALYSKIVSGEVEADMGLAIRAAKLQDSLFWLEKHTLKQMKHATYEDVVAAENLAYEIMTLAKMMGLEEEHSYIPGHVQAIRDLYEEKKTEFDLDVAGLPDYSNEVSGSIIMPRYGFESYSDYPKQATENAKIALRWAEENGWGSCGTPVGKARANQLAKGEPISEETIARMAAFERHRQHSDKELGDGCGRLMWLAWGGDAGIEWAQRKLKQIREGLSQEFSYFDDLSKDKQENLLEQLSNIGYSAKEIEEDYEVLNEPKEKFALPTKSSANPNLPTENKGQYKILYQYTGPRDSKNRTFCKRLLDLDLLFRKEDIQKMSLTGANSEEFGFYDIFTYKGSHGCRHNWRKKYVYRKKSVGLLEVAGLLLDQQRETQENPQQVQAFSKSYKFAVEEDQMRVVGPLMIPQKLIFRVDEEGNPYHVYFSEDTVKRIAYKMMKEEKLDEINLEHSQEDTVAGYMEETWIVEDPENDKQAIYGFDFPKGTWMGQYKIEDPKVWEMVKDGKLNGFSIEGYFADRLVQN